MPTYEYACRACGHEFEEFQSIKADPIAVCPKCRKRKVARKIGIGGAVLFKGGGFYETDYRSESYRSGAEAEKKTGEQASGSARGTPEGNSDGKSDGKPGGKASSGSTPPVTSTEDAMSGRRRDPSSGPGSAAEAESGSASKSPTPSSSKSTGGADGPMRSSQPSDASGAENRRIEARATHPSRIGRGVGNVVGRGGSKSASPASPRLAKPAGRAKGRKRGS